jgi:hypothetical protein
VAVCYEFGTRGRNMPLKYKCKSKEEVAAELANFYAERDGALVKILTVFGAGKPKAQRQDGWRSSKDHEPNSEYEWFWKKVFVSTW